MKDLRFIYIKDNPKLDSDLKKKVNDFIEEGEKFNTKYQLQRTDKVEYEKLKDKKDNSWSGFKDHFVIFTNSRCPICEHIVTKFDDMEHYRPKDHYWWLAYDYTDYYAACALCNRYFKHTKFPLFDESKKVNFDTRNLIHEEQPLLFNPTTDNPLELFEVEFSFNSQHQYKLIIKPLHTLDKNSYLYKKAQTTIQVYNLNNKEQSDLQDFYSKKAQIDTLYNQLEDLAKTKFEFDRKENKTFQDWSNLKQKYKRYSEIGLSSLIMNGNFKPLDKSALIY